MKNISKIAELILKIAGSLNLQSTVKLVNGELGYIEMPKESFNRIIDSAPVEVWFPASKGRKGGTSFISKSFIKSKLEYVGEYKREEMKQEWQGFRHPEMKKRFINDVLEMIGDGEKSTWELIPRLIHEKRWKFPGLLDYNKLFKENGFDVERDKVSKGSNDIQIGLKDKFRVDYGIQRDFDFNRQTLEEPRYKRDLETKGCTQLNFGDEFIERSYAIAKAKEDLQQLLRHHTHKGMHVNEAAIPKIYQDSDSGLFWVYTGSSD